MMNRMVACVYVIGHKPEDRRAEDRRQKNCLQKSRKSVELTRLDRSYCRARKAHQPVFLQGEPVLCAQDDIVTPMLPETLSREYLAKNVSDRLAACDCYATYMVFLTNDHSIREIADRLDQAIFAHPSERKGSKRSIMRNLNTEHLMRMNYGFLFDR